MLIAEVWIRYELGHRSLAQRITLDLDDGVRINPPGSLMAGGPGRPAPQPAIGAAATEVKKVTQWARRKSKEQRVVD